MPRTAGRKRPSPELGRLAHELRTPLAAIQSMADAMHGGHLGQIENERHLAYLASIRDTARHALAVIQAMLEAPAPSEGSAAAVDLSELTAQVVAGLGTIAARNGARLDFRSPAQRLTARANATDVRQMLINLVSNALAHAGGTAEVTVRIAPTADGFVGIEIADNGPGIADAVVERVMAGLPVDGKADPAFGNRVRLGLTLTKSLAEANGGRLELSSSPAGTSARIVLPAADG